MAWKYSEESRHSGNSGWYGTGVGTSAWSTQYKDGELLVTLENGKTYQVTSNIIAAADDTTPDIRWRFVFGGTTSLVSIMTTCADYADSTFANGAQSSHILAAIPANRSSKIAGGTYWRTLQSQGVIRPSSSGDLYFDWAQETASNSLTYVLANSFILVREV
jgi:hypothetical protein